MKKLVMNVNHPKILGRARKAGDVIEVPPHAAKALVDSTVCSYYSEPVGSSPEAKARIQAAEEAERVKLEKAERIVADLKGGSEKKAEKSADEKPEDTKSEEKSDDKKVDEKSKK